MFFGENGQGNEFPYPPLMLFLLSAGRAVTALFASPDPDVFGWADALGFRLPLLLADILILLVLIRWFKTRQTSVLILYWFSPVTIYISYIHGQLDVIPMAFLFLSLHFLFRNKIWLSVMLFAAALGCKTHMVLVLTFYVWYVFRNTERKITGAIMPFLLLAITAVLIHLPFASPNYFEMVFRNKVQNQIFDFYYQFNTELRIIFIPALFMTLLGWYLSLKFVNKNQLLLFLAFVFISLTLLIAPMQGWYYWIIPFAVFFILRHGSEIELRLFVLLNFLYFTYFLLTPNSDFGMVTGHPGSSFFNYLQHQGLDARLFLNLAFTFLQTVLLIFAWHVYKNGIKQNIQSKFLSQPYIIGIGGDSASGKSSLSTSFENLFGLSNTGVIRGDDMHKWERGDEHWESITHLNPGANRLHENLKQSLKLKHGRSIRRSHYDHDTGKFTLPLFIKPRKLLIFEGLHSFYLKDQIDVYDLKIFMEPDEDLRRFWKVKRDVERRGYEPSKVIEQIESRLEDSIRYISSQADSADIRFGFYPLAALPENYGQTVNVGLRAVIRNNLYLDPLINALTDCGLQISLSFDENRQILKIQGDISRDSIDAIAVDLLPEMEEIGIYQPMWQDNFTGVMQLLTAYIIFYKLNEDNES